MIVVLMGETASGKTSLAKELEKNYGFNRIITYTTRKPREGELGNKDYHFITKETFEEIDAANGFIETDYYKDEDIYYGSSYGDFAYYREHPEKNAVAVLTPAGARMLNRAGFNVITVYLCAHQEERIERALKRSSYKLTKMDLQNLITRLSRDEGMFKHIVAECNIMVSTANMTIKEEAEYIIDRLSCFK